VAGKSISHLHNRLSALNTTKGQRVYGYTVMMETDRAMAGVWNYGDNAKGLDDGGCT